MKKIIISLSLLTFIALSIIGCEDYSDLTAPSIDLGSANFSKFVSIGNSLTMGEQSSSVYQAGQIYSFGNIIAQQVGANYAQAIFSDPGTGGRLEIANFNIVNGSPVPVIYENPNTGSPTNLTYPAPYNNLGIKGAFLTDVLNARNATTCYTANFGVPNPLFDAVLRGLGTQLELAIAQEPTLITLWIGNNDILAFATRGGLFPPTSIYCISISVYTVAHSSAYYRCSDYYRRFAEWSPNSLFYHGRPKCRLEASNSSSTGPCVSDFCCTRYCSSNSQRLNK